MLQVLPALETGGAERGAVDVACALAAAGGRAFVASAGGRMVRELERNGVKHFVLPVKTKNPFIMHANAGRIARLSEQLKVDILHARSRAPAWSAYWASQRTGIPFVTTVHSPHSAGGLKKRYNSSLVKGERIIAISDFIADYIRTTYGPVPPRVRVIHRGIDVDIFDPVRVDVPRIINLARAWGLPDGLPVVMLPGRLSRWKGHAVLIEALARLGTKDVCGLIVGADQRGPEYRRELEKLAAARGLGGNMRLVPDCRDMPAAYMLADVVVSASTKPEAFGRVITEAQAMGRPVIATDHGAARETIVPGRTGWTVPPGDADALAAALRSALSLDAAAREAYARESIVHVRRNFSKAKMCGETLDLYREVVAARAAQAPAA
ncbi:MAG: glycosyltransferase family 4 protein [Alphaproteobacteria bacterium]